MDEATTKGHSITWVPWSRDGTLGVVLTLARGTASCFYMDTSTSSLLTLGKGCGLELGVSPWLRTFPKEGLD